MPLDDLYALDLSQLIHRCNLAEMLLQRIVEADHQDAMMGHPNPGDSCIAACIGLEVMPFLDGLGKLPDLTIDLSNRRKP